MTPARCPETPRFLAALMASVSAIPFLVIGGATASAQCAPFPSVANANITCGANDTDGFFSIVDVQSVTIDSGVTVDDTGNAGTGAVGGLGAGVFEFGDPNPAVSPDVLGQFLNNGAIVDTGAPNVGIFIEGGIGGSFINNGTISAASGALVISDDAIGGAFINTGTMSSTLFGNAIDALDINGGFNNSGTITAAFGNAIDAGDIQNGVVNSNLIRGGFNGINIADVTDGFANTGTIAGAINDGVNTLDIFGGFLNSGTITGGEDAVDTDDIAGGFTNTGVLTGVTGDGLLIQGNLTGDFLNTNTISGASDGVEIDASLIGSFLNTGTIRGTGLNSDGVDVNGVVTGHITNTGTVSGDQDGIDVDGTVGGSVTNSGTVIGGFEGFDFSMVTGSFTNTGTVRGGEDAFAVEVGTVMGGFTNSGTIVGDTDGDGVGAGVQIVSAAGQRGTFTNEVGGTITGALAFDSEDGIEDVTNSGTMTGTSGAAIDLGAGTDSLTLTPTSVINGSASGGAEVDALRFGGNGDIGTFSLSDIDTGANTRQYRQFEAFNVVGATWLFSQTTPVPFTVDGGTLGGNAGFGGLTVNDGGTVAPGNSIGTINVTGNVAFNAGSTYAVEIDQAGQSDLIAATGTATLSPTNTTVAVTGLPGGQIYTILTAQGGVTGTFGDVTDAVPDIDLVAIYNPASVQLGYGPAADGNVSPKEIHPSALAGAMDASRLFAETLRRRGGLSVSGGVAGGGNGSMSLGFLPGSDTPTLPARVTAADLPDRTIASPEDARDWAIWGAVLGSDTGVDASGPIIGWGATTGGLAFGVERAFEEDMPGSATALAGIAVGFTTSDIASGTSGADVGGIHVGLYGAAELGGLTLSAAVAYAHQDHDLVRPITAAGVTASGEANGDSLTGSFEAFHDVSDSLGHDDMRFGPLATLDLIHADRDGFTETGAAALNLTVANTSASQAITGLGVTFGLDRAFGTTFVSFDGRVTWEHVFGDRSAATASAIPVAGAGFLTNSAPIDRDRIALGLGTALEMSDTVSAHLRYDGAVSGSTTDHRGSAGLTIRF